MHGRWQANGCQLHGVIIFKVNSRVTTLRTCSTRLDLHRPRRWRRRCKEADGCHWQRSIRRWQNPIGFIVCLCTMVVTNQLGSSVPAYKDRYPHRIESSVSSTNYLVCICNGFRENHFSERKTFIKTTATNQYDARTYQIRLRHYILIL